MFPHTVLLRAVFLMAAHLLFAHCPVGVKVKKWLGSERVRFMKLTNVSGWVCFSGLSVVVTNLSLALAPLGCPSPC